jgi:hypothetical protein
MMMLVLLDLSCLPTLTTALLRPPVSVASIVESKKQRQYKSLVNAQTPADAEPFVKTALNARNMNSECWYH